MLKIENERDLITGGISVDQLKTVASLPVWGNQKPTIGECESYIIGLIKSRLTALSNDEDNRESTYSMALNQYASEISKNCSERLHKMLETNNRNKIHLEDEIFSAAIEVGDISYCLGYYQALIDRNIYCISD